jgi:hypothetical protein
VRARLDTGRRPVLDGADDRGENRTGDAATGDLADDAADIRRRGAIGQQRNQHTENLSADTAADGARDGISKRAEIDVLGRAASDIAADGAADDLDDQVDEHSRHDTSLPRIRCEVFWHRQGAGPSPRRHNLSVWDAKVTLRQRKDAMAFFE